MKRAECFLLVMIFLCASCTKDQWFGPPYSARDNASPYNVISPKIKIAVISDIHYLDPSLLPNDYVNNPDFQADMSMDRKLIELSDPIFRQAMSELIAEKPDIVLLTGDLSREGEKISHEAMQEFLEQLESTGIMVFVIPGNNDVLNSGAVSYASGSKLPVENITSSQFADIYNDFGYEEAIDRDLNSLSYISQPFSNLWILGIDACEYIYDSKKGTYSVKPVLKTATLEWIKEKMVEAREKGITVLAMMHYDIMEHYTGQNMLEKNGIIKDYEQNAIDLMNAGIRLIFTGHFHGNDISEFSNDGNTLTEIETGSLVTPTSPYRIMTLDDNFIKIETRHISDVDAELPEGMDFLTYSDVTIFYRLNHTLTVFLTVKFGLDPEQAALIAPFFTRAIKAHFAGDEMMSPEERDELNALAEVAPSVVMDYLYSIWTDLLPKDNKIHIKLK